jgi:hypothetical protein
VTERDQIIARQNQDLEYLRREIEALKQGKPQEQAKDEPAGNDENFGLKKPNLDDFEDYNDYTEALTDYKVDLKLAKAEAQRAREAEQSAIKEKVTTFQSRVKEFATKVEDFQEVISDVDHIVPSPILQRALIESDNGPELMYALAKDPKEYKRINELSQSGVDRSLGKLEAKLEMSKTSTEPVKKKVKKKTKAPKPLGKVGTKGKGVAKSIYDADKMSQREFERLREKGAI